jgi:hypothetical protein
MLCNYVMLSIQFYICYKQSYFQDHVKAMLLFLPRMTLYNMRLSYVPTYTGCPRTRGSNLQGVFLGGN